MIIDVLVVVSCLAAPPGGGGAIVPSAAASPAGGGGEQPFPGGPGAVRPGGTGYSGSSEPEITAAETALRTAESRAREAQIEVSRRVSEVQEARMGLELARTDVELRKLKAVAKSSDEKSRVKAMESRVSVLRSIIKEDLPAMRELQSRMLRAQLEDPASVAAIQADLALRQRGMARKQVELEIATLKTSGGDAARITAMERRLEEMKKQTPPPGTPVERTSGPGASSGGKKSKP